MMVVASLIAVVSGLIVWFLTLPSSTDGLSMGDYGPGQQRDWAQRLVEGLNTHDVEQVPVLRSGGTPPAQRDAKNRTIEAAMPAPGCRFELASVEDRGEQGMQSTPGGSGVNPTYRFDMTVEQLCPGQQPSTRVLGVMAVAEMGYWEPSHFVAPAGCLSSSARDQMVAVGRDPRCRTGAVTAKLLMTIRDLRPPSHLSGPIMFSTSPVHARG